MNHDERSPDYHTQEEAINFSKSASHKFNVESKKEHFLYPQIHLLKIEEKYRKMCTCTKIFASAFANINCHHAYCIARIVVQ